MKLAPQPVRCILDADHTPRHQLSPFLSIDCRLFVFSFCTPPFVFNSLQPLFRKHPGWGYLHKSSLWNQQLPASFFRPCLQDSYPGCQSCLLSASRRLRGNRFIAPLFSYSYESLFPQTLSFHIHTKPPGWGGPPLPSQHGDCSDVTCCVSRKGLRHGLRRRRLTFFRRLLRAA